MYSDQTLNNDQVNVPYHLHNYLILDGIGTGATSVCVSVKDQRTNEIYCAKIIPIKYENIIEKELNVLKSISHPNIVQLINTLKIRNDKNEEFIVMIMEYCENGDFMTYILDQNPKETFKKKIFKQILTAIDYLHSNGISHGDIKPENILLNSELTPKLCDFGFCKTEEYVGDESKNGTVYYSGPELFESGSFNAFKADIYAIGINLYAISLLSFPFIDGDQENIIKQIRNHLYSVNTRADRELLYLFFRCINPAALERPTIKEILNNEYFSEENEKTTKTDDAELLTNEMDK